MRASLYAVQLQDAPLLLRDRFWFLVQVEVRR